MKLTCIIVLSIGIVKAAVNDPLENKPFLDGYQKFTADIYSKLSKTNPGNLVVCTISLDILLALAEHGSEGETSNQLRKALSLPEDQITLEKAFTELTSNLNVNKQYVLTSANKIYVKNSYELNENFKGHATKVYNAEVENVDFSNAESAAKEMNEWVQKLTSNKIKNLVQTKELSEDTRSVFINALYFEGVWAKKFEHSKTKKDSFQNKNNKIEMDFMEITGGYKYYESKELNAKLIVLPYAGEDVTMTIVLPNEQNELSTLEGKIPQVVLEEANLKLVNVCVKIPKFKIETKVEFDSVLKSLGVINAFEDSAEFPNITNERLKISKIVQKAIIEVNEEGTTAAAATSVFFARIRSFLVSTSKIKFIADHPFIFYLKFRSVTLFIGHYTGEESEI